MQEIKDGVYEVIKSTIKKDYIQLTDEMKLADELMIDSFGYVCLIAELEKRFSIKVRIDEWTLNSNIMVSDVIKMVERCME